MKIGDTVVDVLEGKNAEVNTAMVLTGTQKRADLGAINPNFIFGSVADLKEVIFQFN